MTRIFLHMLIPYTLTCIAFGTGYADLYLMSVIILVSGFIARRKHITLSLFTIIFTVLASLNCGGAYSLSNKSFYPFIGEAVTVYCYPDDIPVYEDESISFTAQMVSVIHNSSNYPVDGKIKVSIDGQSATIAYGDLIDFRTVINLPSDTLDSSHFDYPLHLKSRGIYAVCNADDYTVSNHGRYDGVNPIIYRIATLRKAMADKFTAHFDTDTAVFMDALMLGYKGNMPDEMSNYIARAGISHVISVSGLHLSILMIIANSLLRRLRFRGSALVIPVINIICAFFVTALTGFSPSVCRAALMLLLSNAASMVYRENDSLHSLSFAALVILIINPISVFDVRFVLSATSTLGIILMSDKLRIRLIRFLKSNTLSSLCAATLSAQIITLPLGVYYFNTISVLGILTNLIVVPMIPYLMGLGIAFMIIPSGAIASFIAGGIWLGVNIILDVAWLISIIPFATAETGFARFVYTLLICSAIFILMRKTITSPVRWKNTVYFCISAIAVMMLIFPVHPDSLRITAIDVGQGDCTLIQFPNGKTMLIDGGGSPVSEYDTAEGIIRPHLIREGITQIDYAVISHFHEDHCDGILNLAENFDIGCIIAPDTLEIVSPEILRRTFDICRIRKIPLYLMNEGDTFSPSPEVAFDVYNPPDTPPYEANESSMVIKISAYGIKLLLTGDIDTYTKKSLADSNRDISADIIKVPHHGSDSPYDAEFARAVSPDIAYVCVGANNTYGHPSDNVIKTYRSQGTEVYRTDIHGTTKFTIKKNGNIYIR